MDRQLLNQKTVSEEVVTTRKIIYNLVGRPLESFGSYLQFTTEIVTSTLRFKIYPRLLFQQLEFVGNKSIVIVLLSSIMIGAIFGWQLGFMFKLFKAESMVGAAAALALARELAPVFTAFLVTGRAGAAIAAEIANMKVNEQIDAMRVMSINPIHYLMVPRVISSVVMLPLLVGAFICVGIIAAYVVANLSFHVDVAIFMDKIKKVCTFGDLLNGLVKGTIFGLIFSTISCYQGYHASGGAKGVGRATTKSVVVSIVFILIFDFFLTFLMHEPRQKFF